MPRADSRSLANGPTWEYRASLPIVKYSLVVCSKYVLPSSHSYFAEEEQCQLSTNYATVWTIKSFPKRFEFVVCLLVWKFSFVRMRESVLPDNATLKVWLVQQIRWRWRPTHLVQHCLTVVWENRNTVHVTLCCRIGLTKSAPQLATNPLRLCGSRLNFITSMGVTHRSPLQLSSTTSVTMEIR